MNRGPDNWTVDNPTVDNPTVDNPTVRTIRQKWTIGQWTIRHIVSWKRNGAKKNVEKVAAICAIYRNRANRPFLAYLNGLLTDCQNDLT
uniref:Uncharacterized protein n=1 Tax=Globodera rostochiensis TaxID=31243 RepID=A0A914IB55_GLORO